MTDERASIARVDFDVDRDGLRLVSHAKEDRPQTEDREPILMERARDEVFLLVERDVHAYLLVTALREERMHVGANDIGIVPLDGDLCFIERACFRNVNDRRAIRAPHEPQSQEKKIFHAPIVAPPTIWAMSEFRPVEKHGAFEEVFPNVHVVQSGFRFAPGMGITRNMFVVKQGDELTIVSTARLSPEGEEKLDALGKVKHVVRIGGFHGADDPYYVHRYPDATFWAPKKLTDVPKKQRALEENEHPIEGGKIFLFKHGQMDEAALVLPGGILVTADAYQNWTTFDGCTFLGKLMMRAMGFGPTLIGGPWVKRQGQDIRKDFDRLLDVDFQHLLPGHGAPLRDHAKDGLKTAIANRFKA